MAGVRKKPRVRDGNYQGWYINAVGTRTFFTGAQSRDETLRMARRLEDDHRQVRFGYRPASTSADRHKAYRFSEAKDEYLAWGEAQGGLGGHPWGAWHAKKRRTHLGWWENRLGLGTLAAGRYPATRRERTARLAIQRQGWKDYRKLR